MRVRRYPLHFTILLTLLALLMLIAAYASFSAEISLDDCRALGLPVLTVETEGGKKIKSKEKYLKASFVLIDEAGGYASGGCKIRGRGNTTWRTRELYKKPFLLKLNEAAPLLGFPAADKWVLMANTADKTQLRNRYAERLAARVWDKSPWTPQSRCLSLFVNGRYEGLYALTEKIEAVQGRLPIAEEDGSFVFEVNSRLNKDYNFRSSRGVPFSVRTAGYALLREDEFGPRQAIIQQAEDALFSGDGSWRALLDEETFADWYLINELTKNHDARFQSSCYLWYDAADRKIRMGPAWDFDIACGNISWDGCEEPAGFWISGASWFTELLKDEGFVTLVRRRWFEKRSALDKSLVWLTEEAGSLRPAVMLNDAVWKNIGHRQWPHAPGWKARKTYESELQYMTDWLTKRIAWLDGAFGTGMNMAQEQ